MDVSPDEKYKATKLWNDVIRAFREYMPVRRHLKQLKFYDDTFTGREAVEFIINYDVSKFLREKISREQAVYLLGKFHRKGLFEDISNEFAAFKYNGLYKFCALTSKEIAETPLAVKIQSRIEPSRVVVETDKTGCSPFSARQPSVPPRPVTTLSYRRFGSLDNVDNNNGPVPRSFINPGFQPRSKTNVDPQTFDGCTVSKEATKIKVYRTVDFNDIEKLWKASIVERFNSLMVGSGVEIESLPCDDKIQVNATSFSSNGICKVLDRKDDFPQWVLEAMKCLGNWPWYKGTFQQAIYTGFERDVFYSLQDHLREIPSLLPDAIQLKILEILETLEKMNQSELDINQCISLGSATNGAVIQNSGYDDIKFMDENDDYDTAVDENKSSTPCRRQISVQEIGRHSGQKIVPEDLRLETEFGSASSPVTRLVSVGKPRRGLAYPRNIPPSQQEIRSQRPQSCFIPSERDRPADWGPTTVSSLDLYQGPVKEPSSNGDCQAPSPGFNENFVPFSSSQEQMISPVGIFHRASVAGQNRNAQQNCSTNNGPEEARSRASWAVASVSRTIRSSLRKLSKSSQFLHDVTDSDSLSKGAITGHQQTKTINNASSLGEFVIVSSVPSQTHHTDLITAPCSGLVNRMNSFGDKPGFATVNTGVTGGFDIPRTGVESIPTQSPALHLDRTFVIEPTGDGAGLEGLDVFHTNPSDIHASPTPVSAASRSNAFRCDREDSSNTVSHGSLSTSDSYSTGDFKDDIANIQLVTEGYYKLDSTSTVDESNSSRTTEAETLSVLQSLPGLRTTPELLERLRIFSSPRLTNAGSTVTFAFNDIGRSNDSNLAQKQMPKKLTSVSSNSLDTSTVAAQNNITPFARGAVRYRSNGAAVAAAQQRNSRVGIRTYDHRSHRRASSHSAMSAGSRFLRHPPRNLPLTGASSALDFGLRSSMKQLRSEASRGRSRVPVYTSGSVGVHTTRAILEAQAPGSRFSVASNIFTDPDDSRLSKTSLNHSLLPSEKVVDFAEALHLLFLLLPSGPRRRIQLLLRLMHKMITNRLLHLDNLLSNEIVVVEALAGLILPLAEEEIGRDRLCRIVRVMVAKNDSIFKRPVELSERIDQRVSRMKKEEILIEATSSDQVTFCDRVAPSVYESQRQTVSSEQLLTLLDAIVNDENMKPHHKKKRMQMFAKSYPDLFKTRFPTEASYQALFPPKPSAFQFQLLKKLRM